MKRGTLSELIEVLETLDREHTIYAARPWTVNSEAIVTYDVDGRVPPEAAGLGLSYFLEVFISLEVVEQYEEIMGRQTPEVRFQKVLYYAENDAYEPD